MEYKYGDVVRFRFKDQEREGVVYIIDHGVFEERGLHYDIYVKEENMLYKHIRAEDCY